ncbi:MAG: class I SAM-dependent methyltransferase [Bacteroidia bacterium]
MSNFNHIASIYDMLARLIFGSNLYNAKIHFLNVIKHGSNILIIGGGTGDILNKLLTSTQNTVVDFIEPSQGMIKNARQNLLPEFVNRVNFINDNHNIITHHKQYDVVMAFFIFDIFKQDEALLISKKINDSLKENGLWLFADFFYTENYFQRCLIWLMYRFFKITTGISANKLPDYDVIFKQLKVALTHEKYFMKGLVKARVYKKETG